MEERISIKENERYKILEYYNRPHKNKIFNLKQTILVDNNCKDSIVKLDHIFIIREIIL